MDRLLLETLPGLKTDQPAWKKQEAFISSVADETGYVGGFGSGKTLSGSFRTSLLCNHIPGNRIIVLRRTYRELKDSTWRTFMEWLPPDLYAGERKSDDIVFVRTREGPVSEVWFRSLNNPEKFKSTEVGAVWIDEATEATEDEIMLLKGRLRLPHVPYRPIYYTTNPCPKSHWLYKSLVENAVPDKTKLIQTSTYENRGNLPKGYIEELERNYPPDWIEMYLKGEFGITLEGIPVLPGFRATVTINDIRVPWHVASKPLAWDRDAPLKRGWDPGRVRPACAVWQISREGQYRKLWESLGHNQPGNIYIPLVKRELSDRFPGAIWHDYMDPAGFQPSQIDDRSWYDELSFHGINVIKIPKTSPSSRADILNRMMHQTTKDGQPLIVCDPSCDITVEAWRGGWHRRKPETGKPVHDDPMKDGYYEHLMDADGYILVGTYEQPTGRNSAATAARIKEALKKRSRSYS